jgi:hypothetical protein
LIHIDQARQDIESWIINFVEQPNPALAGWPPCPYARRARLDNTVHIRLGIDVYTDLMALSRDQIEPNEVIIYVYDPREWSYEKFHQELASVNSGFLLPKDIIALEDHPDDPEWVNGVCMNQGQYALAMCQSLKELDAKAKLMAEKGFYDSWPEEYLTALFENRKDPRR